MARSKIVWTILPYGMTDGKQRVSVVVSPRLIPENRNEHALGAFPEFVNWPEVIKDAKFSVETGDDTIPLKLISEIDESLWHKLFSEETPVNGFEYEDLSEVNFRSYQIRNILSYLRKYYAKLAEESPSDLPRLLPWDKAHPVLKEMLEVAGTDGPLYQKNGGLNRLFREDEPDKFNSETERDLYLANRFYSRPRPESVPKPPVEPEYDFHRIVASLADFPELMRRLGLVLDFVLTAPIGTQSRGTLPGTRAPTLGFDTPIRTLSGKLRLRIKRKNQQDQNTDDMPWTAFLVEGQRFITRSETDELKNGLLNMAGSNDKYENNSGRFDIYQVDPDGSALKTVGFVVDTQNLLKKDEAGSVAFTTGDQQGVAALRSGGLGVSRHERAKDVAQNIARMTEYNKYLEDDRCSDIVLYAEDVLRGYRVDVADERNPGVWRTLCARVGDYRLIKTGEPIDSIPEDEGYVCGASTTSQPGSKDQYLHESLFRWTGWSLCTPRPGLALKAVQEEGSDIQSEVPSKKGVDVAKNGCGVSANFTTPGGSLPRLRYGRSYRFRARVVDLAGNSLAVDDPLLDNTCASDSVGYWRFEPIDPPVIVHRTRVSEGESLERMVIRSNYNVSSKDYSGWLRGESSLPISSFSLHRTPGSPAILEEVPFPDISSDFYYGAVNERHFVPPKSSQQQCEMHGLFDPYFGNWEDIKNGYELAAKRESGTLYDGLPERKEDASDSDLIKLITPSALDDVATTKGIKPGLPSDTNPVGDRMVGGQYVIHGETHIRTPWLPDGAAGGTAIRAAAGHELPGVNNIKSKTGSYAVTTTSSGAYVILIYSEKKWPDSDGFRLILAEREAEIDPSACKEVFRDRGEPLWDEINRTLTFFVPKGRIVRLVYSSFADEKFIGSFGIPQWVGGTRQGRVLASALRGANWLITPFRELTLVHATQAPVFKPKFTYFSLSRAYGSHDVILRDAANAVTLTLHGPSTSKFEVEAEWHEWVDDPTKDEPERVKFRGQLGEIRLAENHANTFDLRTTVNGQLPDPNKNAQRGDVHALGDTRFRLIDYRIRATTRFSEYLPPSICANPDNVTQLGPAATNEDMRLAPPDDDPGAPIVGVYNGPGSKTFVPASTPPADPRVMYILPTMRWKTNEKADGHDVTRDGNGLRIWLDRPWFSSGDGELLGVVIPIERFGAFSIIPSKMQPFVTQWGRDPFWNSEGGYSMLQKGAKKEDFCAGVASEILPLQEMPSSQTQVMIVGHRVHWDGERKLWYCDIEFDPLKAYMPFVRLALVRYQPNALRGAKISKVVLTDFAQVLPNRRATVKVKGDKITAALYGPTPFSGPMVSNDELPSDDIKKYGGRNRVELVLQKRDKSLNSDLDWEDTKVLAAQVVDPPAMVPNELPFWQAVVPYDRAKEDKNKSYRLMLREFERFYIIASPKKLEKRLVFADIIPLEEQEKQQVAEQMSKIDLSKIKLQQMVEEPKLQTKVTVQQAGETKPPQPEPAPPESKAQKPIAEQMSKIDLSKSKIQQTVEEPKPPQPVAEDSRPIKKARL